MISTDTLLQILLLAAVTRHIAFAYVYRVTIAYRRAAENDGANCAIGASSD